jgi:NitT/TauT family transport system substrate-binding protein
MSQPDGMIALFSGLKGHSDITAHFGGPPYQYQELTKPGVHKVLSSYDVLGGSHTYTQIYATSKVYDDNPKVSKAFFEALQDADAIIKKDKKRAAQIYRNVSGDKRTSDEIIMTILDDPDVQYTVTPKRTMEFAKFMHTVGTIKIEPKSWKDLFFPIVHDLPGS